MGKEIISLSNIKVKKHKFHKHKSPISIYDKNFDRIIMSSRVSLDKKAPKYFIGYKDYKKVRYLCVMLLKMSPCRRDFIEIKYMSFFDKN